MLVLGNFSASLLRHFPMGRNCRALDRIQMRSSPSHGRGSR
ncbi:MAG: hypothetical protein N838_21000 [Thiohalocapsa sp. PB-PSB1]|nr:MAG: hypothetical protein N838_21000 [Thiohalocapsa sp. PB-PSB1]